MIKVVFAPEVEEDLYELIEILVEKEYLGTYAFAISYVEDLVLDIQKISMWNWKEKRLLFLNDMAKNCNMSLIKEMRTQRGMFFSLL